ncbi:MAG TPA: MotA/TolQ/ExbB proton channel family protein [bacterium]|nr:MotA/TolQ/ExbB proton channel family protein [bacterium]
MVKKRILIILSLCLLCAVARAQVESASEQATFSQAADSLQRRLEVSISELNELRQQVAQEKIPLSRKLSDVERELAETRQKYQETTRLLDGRTLELANLKNEITARQEEATYLSGLLHEYIRSFESRLHIAESHRYKEALEQAKLASQNSNLSQREIFVAEAALLKVSLERLEDCLGGTRFEASVVDSNGIVKEGMVLRVGPAALFRSKDCANVGTVEQRLGSLEPAVIAFSSPSDVTAAAEIISEGTGFFPLDPTLGNAHKIEATQETFLEHVKKGGPVMYPIFALAGSALLVSLYKYLSMLFIRRPSQKRVQLLLSAVAAHDKKTAEERARRIGGPVGRMLATGVEHLKEPKELIEEVMYEHILSTRFDLQRFLPFIAISAASAPLLGLLGTVTGIINTFKLITVFGSGDVKTLSSGISEALITTEFGLIVAIPSLLIHAFLSRKARGVIVQMEKAAVAFVNQVSKTPYKDTWLSESDTASVKRHQQDKRETQEPVELLSVLAQPERSHEASR